MLRRIICASLLCTLLCMVGPGDGTAQPVTDTHIENEISMCDAPPEKRKSENYDGRLPIVARGSPERIDEVGLTVEPVLFDINPRFHSSCFMRVIAVDDDSIFSNSLAIGQIFIGLHESEQPEMEPPIPAQPMVENPHHIRERVDFAQKYGLNTLMWIKVYEGDEGATKVEDYDLVSSFKTLSGGMTNEEPVRYVRDCIYILRSFCK